MQLFPPPPVAVFLIATIAVVYFTRRRPSSERRSYIAAALLLTAAFAAAQIAATPTIGKPLSYGLDVLAATLIVAGLATWFSARARSLR